MRNLRISSTGVHVAFHSAKICGTSTWDNQFPMTSISKFTLLSIAICGMVFPLDALAQLPAPPAVAAVCAPCHGLDGIGHDVEIPNIAGQHSIYLHEQLGVQKRPTKTSRNVFCWTALERQRNRRACPVFFNAPTALALWRSLSLPVARAPMDLRNTMKTCCAFLIAAIGCANIADVSLSPALAVGYCITRCEQAFNYCQYQNRERSPEDCAYRFAKCRGRC